MTWIYLSSLLAAAFNFVSAFYWWRRARDLRKAEAAMEMLRDRLSPDGVSRFIMDRFGPGCIGPVEESVGWFAADVRRLLAD